MTTPAKLKLQRLARKQQAEALKSKSVGKRKCKFNNPDCTWGKCFCTKSIGKKKPVGEKKVTVIQCPICWVVCRENIYKKHIKSHKEYDKGCCLAHDAGFAGPHCNIPPPVSSKCECICHYDLNHCSCGWHPKPPKPEPSECAPESEYVGMLYKILSLEPHERRIKALDKLLKT